MAAFFSWRMAFPIPKTPLLQKNSANQKKAGFCQPFMLFYGLPTRVASRLIDRGVELGAFGAGLHLHL
jgi:hypothetical protein